MLLCFCDMIQVTWWQNVVSIRYDSSLRDACSELAEKWSSAADDNLAQFLPGDTSTFSAGQLQQFVAELLEKVSGLLYELVQFWASMLRVVCTCIAPMSWYSLSLSVHHVCVYTRHCSRRSLTSKSWNLTKSTSSLWWKTQKSDSGSLQVNNWLITDSCTGFLRYCLTDWPLY